MKSYPFSFVGIHESKYRIKTLDRFKTSLIGSNTNNNGLFGVGIYFTTQKRKIGYGKIKNKFLVKMKYPFVISKASVLWLLNKINIKDPKINFALDLGYYDIAFIQIMRGNSGNKNARRITKKLIIMGFDGVIYEKDGEIIEACLFRC